MKKLGTILCTLMLCITSLSMTVKAYDDPDIDKDGNSTYYDQNESTIDMFRRGYSTMMSTFEMYYVSSNPYVVDIGLPSLNKNNERGERSYRTQSTRIKRYYNVVRYDRDMYPRDTRQWYGTRSWYDEELGDWACYVNCTYPHTKLTTPETIFFDGHKCQVVGIALKNAYVKELTITDNIKYINACQCPRLQQITGGKNVRVIGERAFYNDIYLVNFPYFPNLEEIGPYAFEGCLNMTDVLLPSFITTFYASAFGWYDVVLGNYDMGYGTQDAMISEYEALKDNYKIFGITLYAAKNTDTYKTLNEIFGGKIVGELCRHVSFAESKKYPGRKQGIIIDDNEEVEEWLPPLIDPSTIDWSDVPTDEKIDYSDPVKVQNSLNLKEKDLIEYVEFLLATEQIDLDMALTLISGIAGLNLIPPDFVDKFGSDPKCEALVNYNLEKCAKNVNKVTSAPYNTNYVQMAIDNECYNDRLCLLYYIVNDMDNIEKVISKFTSNTGSFKVTNKYLMIIDTINRLLMYVNQGDTWEQAAMKTGATFIYLLVATPPTPLAIYEASIYFMFGSSKAGDALSFITTGRHAVEALNDMFYKVFYDAWEQSDKFADNLKWRAFYTISYMNAKEFYNDLKDVDNAKYGQNITNWSYIFDLIITPGAFGEIFDGYVEMFANETVTYTYLEGMYDFAVKDNRFGKILYSFVENYYSKTDRVLVDVWRYQ